MDRILFEIYFSDGSIHTQEANGPLQAAILAQANSIRLDFSFEIDSIRNEETGQVYEIKQKIKEATE